MKTIFREISPVRRTSRPRMSAGSAGGSGGGFGALMLKLSGASSQLNRTRARRKRKA